MWPDEGHITYGLRENIVEGEKECANLQIVIGVKSCSRI